MKDLHNFINEGGITKSFILNMKEIDYDKLIEFIKDMQSKNEDFIEIQVDSNRKWIGYSKGKTDNNRSNKTELN
jgi:hypothetical protein